MARQHIPGCPLSEVSIELASCPCAIDDTGIIAAVLAHVSAEGGMLKVDMPAARAAIDALTRLGVGVDEAWQPIETAPRDGTQILAWSPGNKRAINKNARDPHMRADRRVERYHWQYARQLPEAPYTHWRPLPSPPSPSPEPAPTDSRGEG